MEADRKLETYPGEKEVLPREANKKAYKLVFLPKIFMSGKINELWGLKETGMHWNERFASELYNHGYCGTIMIGGYA